MPSLPSSLGVQQAIPLALGMIILPVILIALTFYLQPQWVMTAVQSRFDPQSILFYVPTTTRVMTLTIDDAPSNSTEDLLDVLKETGAKATFFIISDYVRGREETLRRMVREECEETIRRYQPEGRFKWFRPGQGWFTSSMREALKARGYRLVLGNVYPHDANGIQRLQSDWPTLNALYLRKRARPGAIAVVHDRPWTVEVLRRALPDLTSRFEVLTLSDLVRRYEGAGAAQEDNRKAVIQGGPSLRGVDGGMVTRSKSRQLKKEEQ